MARYFAQAQRKDADATKPPGPGYVGAINDEYLKHKITEMMKAFERMTKKVFGQNVVQLTSLKQAENGLQSRSSENGKNAVWHYGLKLQ